MPIKFAKVIGSRGWKYGSLALAAFTFAVYMSRGEYFLSGISALTFAIVLRWK